MPARYWPRWLDQQLRDRLLAAYDDPGRAYHDRRHLAEVLTRIGEIDPRAGEAVLLAAWFHDSVYDIRAGSANGSNEERSARWAESELADAGAPEALAAEVARLVRLTESHDARQDDVNGQVLCDADLAILAADPSRYAEYVAGVRAEHAHLSDEEFAAGRGAVLRALLDKPTLFHTRFAREHWERAGREAIRRELGTMA